MSYVCWQLVSVKESYSLTSSYEGQWDSVVSIPSPSSGTDLVSHWLGQLSLTLNNRNTTRTVLNDKTWGSLNWKSWPTAIASHCPAQWLLFCDFSIVLWEQYAMVHPSVAQTKMFRKWGIIFFFWKQKFFSRPLWHFPGVGCMLCVHLGSNPNSPIILCYYHCHILITVRMFSQTFRICPVPAFSQPLPQLSGLDLARARFLLFDCFNL